MPRIKNKEQRKMEKLKSFNDLSKVIPIPEEAFAPAKATEVPEGAFDTVKKTQRGEYPAYVKYEQSKNAYGDHTYAKFVFNKSLLEKHFKKLDKNSRFELVQGKTPHNDWFMLRPAILKRGNKMCHHGAVFYCKNYLNTDRMDKEAFYPLDIVFKDGALYAKLPPELARLLR
jgi:hypothetical protein